MLKVTNLSGFNARRRIAVISSDPPSGDISFSELTQGNSLTNGVSTASISPTADSQVFVGVAVAVAGGGWTHPSDIMSLSGCNLTWTQIGTIEYGVRRRVYAFSGTGNSPTTGGITLTFTSGGSGTFQEFVWSVDEAINVNLTTPTSNLATNTNDGGSNTLTVTVGGTVDTGDFVYAVFGLEDTGKAPSLDAQFTELTNLDPAGPGVRALVCGYDGTATVSQTPTLTWSTAGSNCGGIAFIIEKA